MASEGSARTQPSRLRSAAGAFATNWRNPDLRRAQAASFAAWTAEWAVTVVLAVYAYGRGGATEVGVVALVRVLPAAIVAPLATQYADRWPREKVLVAVSVVRSVTIALAGWAVFVDGPALIVYALVTVSSAAAVLFRPVHSALLPSLCDTRAGAGGRQRRPRGAGLGGDPGRPGPERGPARHRRAGPGARRGGRRVGVGRMADGPCPSGTDPRSTAASPMPRARWTGPWAGSAR